LLTGTTGFIGKAIVQNLLLCKKSNNFLTLAIRHPSDTLQSNIKSVLINNILPTTDWSQALANAKVVIHLAARAHILNDTATNPLVNFRETNTAGTLNLARQAATAGVRRFIFISSIGVNGNQTFDKPFTVTDIPNPTEPYAISKHEAELGLKQIAAQTGMEVVIIRPPLVYGANAPGNFGKLIKTLASRIPLPLGSIHNHRSLVALPNLIDLITTCIDHPAAANQTFLVSDGEDLSTTDLLRRLGHALGKPARLLPVPQKLLETTLTLLGKRAIAQRLCGNLQIDMTHTCQTLNWKPPVNVDEALYQTAQAYLQAKQ
jgi:nucleoside-diphosphate-sugar epimerase